MKKHLWIISIVGVIVVVLYSIVAHSWLLFHSILKHQDIAAGRNAAWSFMALCFSITPIMLWLQMNSIQEKTEDDINQGTWKRIRYHYNVLFPYKDRFNLFLAQHPIALYIVLLIPVLYFVILIALIAVNMIAECISWQWFKLMCWWDDFKVMHL